MNILQKIVMKYSSSKLFYFYCWAAHRGYLSFLSLDPSPIPIAAQVFSKEGSREQKVQSNRQEDRNIENEGLAIQGRMIR